MSKTTSIQGYANLRVDRDRSSNPNLKVPYMPVRPTLTKQYSSPHIPLSPMRHHRRAHSSPRLIRESTNARLKEGDDGVRMLNNYIIKHEIGRGAYGSVNLAVHTLSQEEFAVKEVSKSRIRKKSAKPPRSRALRQLPPAALRNDSNDGLDVVKREVAILKKLDHENVVKLIEVLDDAEGDSLFMVLEFCKNGVIMDVGPDKQAEPKSNEECRNWFRDLILGIEYLHAHEILHRDIKPDNLLLNEDNVLKIVDFGVSEIFTKDDDRLIKSAGSPAFMAPELCSAKHGNFSGKSADLWSMGITLYCLKFGRLPFNDPSILKLYDSIVNDQPELPEDTDQNLKHLFERILDKRPENRIKMPELREHPWITMDGEDPLLSYEENTAEIAEPVTEEELRTAIKGISGVMTVVKAVHKFKQSGLGKLNHLRHSDETSERSTPSSPAVSPELGPVEISSPSLLPRANSIDNAHLDSTPEMSTSEFPRSTPRMPDIPSLSLSSPRSRGEDDDDHLVLALDRKTPSPLPNFNYHNPRFDREESTDTIKASDRRKEEDNNNQHDRRKEENTNNQHDNKDDGSTVKKKDDYLNVGIGGKTRDENGEGLIMAQTPGTTSEKVYDKAFEEQVAKLKSEGKELLIKEPTYPHN